MKVHRRFLKPGQKKNQPNGFSFVEIMIAGLLLATSMVSVSRMSLSAWSSGSKTSERESMEGAINDDIQTLQKEDSYLTIEQIKENGELSNACESPTSYLRDHLLAKVEAPRSSNVTRIFQDGDIPGILKIIYGFEGPEEGIGTEYRVVEMNPNFASECYDTM